MGTREYIVICQQIIGSGPWVTSYRWDGVRFMRRQDAIKHGFTLDRSDDFNIGVLDDGKLEALWWMDEELLGTDIDNVAKQIGLSARSV